MHELFSDIFAYRDNVLARIDPRVKIVIALTLIATVVLSKQALFPILVFVSCTAGMLLLRMPVRLVLLRPMAPIGIVLVLVVLQAFLTGANPLASFSFAGWKLIATEEGLLRGVVLGSRVLGAVSVMLLLSFVTPAHKIFAALRWFRIPEGWVEIALLMCRYTFVLLDQAADIAAAQRVRLGYSSARHSLSSIGLLAGTLVARSMDQAMRTYEAMTLRGYQGRLPIGPLAEPRSQDWLIMFVGPLTAVAVYLIVEWWLK